jgi:hypothetical protein
VGVVFIAVSRQPSAVVAFTAGIGAQQNKTQFHCIEKVLGSILLHEIFSRANPSIISYNASVANFYNGTDHLAFFKAGVVAVKSKIV